MNILYTETIDLAQNSYEFRKTLEEFRDRLSFDYNLRDKHLVATVRDLEKAIFFGDIHGDLETLYTLCKKTDLLSLLRDSWYAVFLGDYVDRGYNQVETLMFVAKLKNLYPSRVITLRGNHEPYKHLTPYPHDYPNHLFNRFGKREGVELYELSREVFDLMPLALYSPGKLLAVHGGPPIIRVVKYDNIEDILRVEKDLEAIEDILWSDPVEDEELYYTSSYRGAGKLWGAPITIRTLEKLDIKLIIRGHEPVEGYRFNHRGRVLTLFSMKGHYNNTYASCLKLDLRLVDDVESVRKNIISV
ncbi:MAG: metallophosphoesterase family protein [Ignisphaera sp.]